MFSVVEKKDNGEKEREDQQNFMIILNDKLVNAKRGSTKSKKSMKKKGDAHAKTVQYKQAKIKEVALQSHCCRMIVKALAAINHGFIQYHYRNHA